MLDPAFLRLPLAHRTLHDITAGRPENSLAGARAAIEAGYGIELDLQISADGQAMVFHDDTLERLTSETGPVHAHTAAALQKVALRHGDEPIPTLRQLLDLVAGRVPLLIELKCENTRLEADVGPLARATARDLQGYVGPVGVMSFNPYSVKAFRDVAPDIPRGLVTDRFTAEDWPTVTPARRAHLALMKDLGPLEACFISHNQAQLDDTQVADVRAAGLPVLCWTVRNAEAEARARQTAHNITFEGYLPTIPDAAA